MQPSVQLPNLIKQDSKSIVSYVRARLISTICLPANYAAAVPVKIIEIRGAALIESESLVDGFLQVDRSLVDVN